MSRIKLSPTRSGRSPLQSGAFFTQTNIEYGKPAVRSGIAQGASWASALLGPDLMLTGQHTPGNQPTASSPVWYYLQQLVNPRWVRGHLINAGWGGRGDIQENLVPLTMDANRNHQTVETFIRNFLDCSRRYDEEHCKNDEEFEPFWYGVYYRVQSSLAPLAAPEKDHQANPFSHVPEFIRVSWRAVKVKKPLQAPDAGKIDMGSVCAVDTLPFHYPIRTFGQVLPPANQPAGNRQVNGPGNGHLARLLGEKKGNGFDGDVEIHQFNDAWG